MFMILGIDVGGTHTDSVLMKGRKIIRKSKVLTDKENILNCVMMATEAVAKPEDIKNLERIVLSTTLTTNAVVQNQLAPVGLVVMNGPGVSPKDLPLYDKANYVAGYMSHRGIEAEAPDRSELAELKAKFKKEKINRLAIVGKFSTRNPAHEQLSLIHIWLQAANTQLRKKLGRLASREEAGATLNELADTGASVVIDLLYGLPGQTEEILIEDVRYISEQTRIAGLDLYELRMFPGSPLDKAIERGKMPPMPEFPEKARLFGTAYKNLIAGGFEHFSPRHWRRTPNERSLYNRLAGGQTDMIPFGSAAGGRLGTIGLSTARDIKSYTEMVERGEKPLGRITEAPLAVEKTGFDKELDMAFETIRVPAIDKWPDSLRESGSLLLAQWKKAGLLEGDVNGPGMGFTCAGFYWSSRMKKLLLEFVAEPVPA